MNEVIKKYFYVGIFAIVLIVAFLLSVVNDSKIQFSPSDSYEFARQVLNILKQNKDCLNAFCDLGNKLSCVDAAGNVYARNDIIEDALLIIVGLTKNDVDELTDEYCGSVGGSGKGLVLKYSFDDGTATDSSGNGNDGIISGAVTTSGQKGQALEFDGKDDYVNAGSGSSLDNLNALTYSAWIYPTNFATREIISKSGSNKELRVGRNGLLRGCVDTSPGVACSNTNTGELKLNQWQHIAMTYDHNGERKVKLFIDGKESSYNKQDTGGDKVDDDSNSDLWIGRRTTGDREYRGKIDEVLIYDRALTDSEISDLASGKVIVDEEIEESCTDSDGGDVPEVFGIVSYVNGTTIQDRCVGTQVLERFCDQYGEGSYHSCEFGCGNGACLSSNQTLNQSSCTESWSCSSWSSCDNGKQTRTCSDNNKCGTINNRPSLNQSCTVVENSGSGELLIYYRNFSNGLAIDNSGNGLDGIMKNGAEAGFGVSGTEGLSLDGTDDYVNAGSDGKIDNLMNFSYSAWIYPTDDGDREIISKSGSDRELRLGGTGNGLHLRGCVDTSPGAACSNSISGLIKLNTWQHITMTYGHNYDKKVRLYINGKEVSYTSQSTGGSTTDNDSSFDLWIGRRTSGDRAFKGFIDEIKIYGRVLSAGEISSLAS